MASQHRSIGEVPSEVLLHIVEHMDTDTRERFMATNKGICKLIESYEHTISKARTATFTLPPFGNILSSSTEERHVLLKNTFSMVRELELRDYKIGRLIAERPSVFDLASPPWLPCLTARQQVRLGLILRRALHQCDRIADIAANVPCLLIEPEWYHAIIDGVYELPSALSSDKEALYQFNPLTRPDARPKQIEYIQSLSLEEIAGVFILVNMLGYGLTCFCSSTAYERKTVVEECVLRHGTWFVWHCLLGDPIMRELTRCIISAGRAEVREWETGAIQGPRGLKMTLMSCLNEKVGGDTKDEIADNIAETLRKLVMGDEKERTG